MDKKARTPLLALNILSNVALVVIMVILFVIYIVIGALAGGFGGNPGPIILTVFIIDILLALVVILNVINMACGFRKKETSKTINIAMIIVLIVMMSILIGICIYFVKKGASYAQVSVEGICAIFATIPYLILYLCNIFCVYVPRIKNSKKSVIDN